MTHDEKIARAIGRLLDARQAEITAFVEKDIEHRAVLKTLLAHLATTTDSDKLTAAYILMRNAKHAAGRLAETMDEDYKERMADVEGVLLKRLLDNKANSMQTAHGTFYKEETMKPSCNNWPDFYKFIAENDAFEALEKRVTKKFIQDYVEQHKELPPGVTVHRETVVRVRTKNEK